MTETPSPRRELTVAGDRIEYSDTGGPGETILLVHPGCFRTGLARVASSPELDGFRVVQIVRAGYTDGPAPTRHVPIADHASHAAALLEHLDVAHARVVGHSSGSAVAMALGLARPELVDGLVLGEPPLVDHLVDPADREFLATAIGPVLGSALAAAASGDVVGAFDTFMSAVCGPDWRAAVAGTLGPEALDRAEFDARRFFADEVDAVVRWPFDSALAARLTGPVLLVQGGASDPVTHRLVAHVAGMLPHAEVATIEGDNHLLPFRSPDDFGRLVARFAQRHPARRAAVGSM